MKNIILIMVLAIVASCSKKIDYDLRLEDNNINSYFTIEKTLISPKLPTQSNKITYHALDVRGKPITGLNVVLDVTSDFFPSEELVLNEVTAGIYEGIISKNDSYKLNIKNGHIAFMHNRFVGNVNVVDKTYCYVNNGLEWKDYDQDGDGNAANPYKICTVEQLRDLALNTNTNYQGANANNNHFTVMVDTLDIGKDFQDGNPEFIIAENTTEPFTGVFDGNGSNIKGFTSTKSEVALFKYVSGGKISNFKYSYNISGSIADSVGGLIYEVKTSTATFEVSKIDFTGTLVSNDHSVELGGLIKKASSANNILVKNIKGSLTVTGKGKISGLASEVVGIGALKPSIESIDLSMNLTSNSTLSNSQISASGLVNKLTNSKISNAKVSIQGQMSSHNVVSVSGVAGTVVDSSVDNAYSIGQVQVNDISIYGGVVAEQTNSQIRNSFSLLNMSGNTCQDFCGSVLGKTNGGVNTIMSNLYTSNQTTLLFPNFTGVHTIVESTVNTISNPTYFFLSSNLPMSNWDFVTVWRQESGLTPAIR